MLPSSQPTAEKQTTDEKTAKNQQPIKILRPKSKKKVSKIPGEECSPLGSGSAEPHKFPKTAEVPAPETALDPILAP